MSNIIVSILQMLDELSSSSMIKNLVKTIRDGKEVKDSLTKLMADPLFIKTMNSIVQFIKDGTNLSRQFSQLVNVGKKKRKHGSLENAVSNMVIDALNGPNFIADAFKSMGVAKSPLANMVKQMISPNKAGKASPLKTLLDGMSNLKPARKVLSPKKKASPRKTEVDVIVTPRKVEVDVLTPRKASPPKRSPKKRSPKKASPRKRSQEVDVIVTPRKVEVDVIRRSSPPKKSPKKKSSPRTMALIVSPQKAPKSPVKRLEFTSKRKSSPRKVEVDVIVTPRKASPPKRSPRKAPKKASPRKTEVDVIVSPRKVEVDVLTPRKASPPKRSPKKGGRVMMAMVSKNNRPASPVKVSGLSWRDPVTSSDVKYDRAIIDKLAVAAASAKLSSNERRNVNSNLRALRQELDVANRENFLSDEDNNKMYAEFKNIKNTLEKSYR